MKKFDPARAAVLDDAERLSYADPARILALLDLPANATLVDFGTGTGVYAIEIAERRPDVHVIALDEQPVMLERLRAKPRAQRANIEPRLPDVVAERAGRVDRVLALNVLHELEDESLAALRSLLRDDGCAVVIDWNPAVDRPRGPKADHLFTAAQAVEHLARFGLRAESREGGFPYHLAWVCRP
jgi:cyclopropane fatty-acyl-phospholipid synthase-like methyltransferase